LAQGADEDLLEDELLANGPPSSSDVEIVEHPPEPAATSRSHRSQRLADKTNATQNLSPKKKRVASTTLTKPAPAKKARGAAVEVHDSDDSDDELKFRFRKRK